MMANSQTIYYDQSNYGLSRKKNLKVKSISEDKFKTELYNYRKSISIKVLFRQNTTKYRYSHDSVHIIYEYVTHPV